MCGRLSRVSLLVFILTSMLMLNIVQGPSLVSTDNSEMDDAPVQQTSRKIAYTPHDPIVINGDSNFSATAALEGWLGDGSAGDPYVIDSLEIDRQGAALHCINISNTRVNFTISNCNLTGASSPASGIFLDNVTNGRIEGNIVYGNHFNIYLTNAHFNVVKNNTCWGSVYSISMRVSSSNNTITDNDSSNNSDRGVNLESGSQYNVVINNTCVNNRFGVVLYLVSYNIIMNNNFSNNDDHGIHNNDADYNVMINNTCNVNDYGIYLFSSSVYNELSNNTCNDNRNIGIYLVSSGLNDLINNTCSFNSNYGMYLVGSDRCNMYNNTCNGNTLYGLYLVMTDQGVYYDNVFNSNDYGIYQISSQQNTISNNTFANNDVYGISLSGSSLNNILEWNVFVENVISCIDSSSLTNSFVYNFWSDYTGIDANQNAIGDTPYVILGSAGNQDSSPIVIHPSLDIGWTDPPSDQLYEYGEPIIYDVDASAFSGIDQWTVNDTGFNIDSFGVITNSTILPIDLYGLEVTVNDTKGNYLTETITVTVVSVFPTWIEEPTDQFVTYSKTFRYDLNATDYDGLDLWWINDTARFSIDQEGIITNVTTLALGYYALQVSVNDTKGNTLTGEFGVTVWIYNTHEPIVIVGDDDFSNIATIEGWQGAGTSLSPYVIEYMIIDRNGEVGHCISISHTRVNFIIRDSILSSASIDPGSGIYLNNVTNGELINNTCFSNFVGIYLYNSSSNSVVSNNCSSNSHAGIFLYQYGSHNILTDNTCRGNTVGIRLEDGGRDHEVLENYCNENSAYGIFLIRTSFSTVDNNTCNSNLDRGICLESNSNNTVSNNLCSSNTRFGLVLYYSHYNDVFRNNFSFNGEQGVHHRQSSYNNIFENGFNDNYHGYFLWEDSNYNFFTNNSFNYNENDGIEIQGCYYNNFTFNSFSYNSMRGILIGSVNGNNEFRWNTISTNSISSYDIAPTLYDYNYWSRYTGSDADGDGVGDTPYTIDGWMVNQDLHPLMMPPGSPPLWVDAPEDQYVELSFPFQYDLNVTHYSFIDYWWLNDTMAFSINQDGTIVNITALDVGTYGIEVFVNDTSGYLLSGLFNVIVSDTTSPTWIELPVTQVVEFGSDFHYNLNATDLSGLDSWWLNDTTRFNIDANGIVTCNFVVPVGTFGIHVWVNDTYGHVLDAIFNVIVEDTTAPMWVTALTNHQVEEGAPFSYSLEADDLSGLHAWWLNDSIHFAIDGSGVITNLTILPDGVYPCEVRVNDTYGNTLVGVFTLTVLPATPPTWVIEPTDQFVEFGADFLYVLDASDDSGINSWWLNDTNYFAINQSGVITNIAPLPVGVHRLLVSVNDLWGHTLSHGLVITVADTTAPTWVIEPTDQFVEFGEGLLYDLDATDYSGIDSWWLNDTSYFAIDQSGVITNTAPLAVGVYRLLVSVSDLWGHTLSHGLVITVADTTAPSWVEFPENQVVEYGSHLSYDLDVYDLSEIDEWWVNDTDRFTVDWTGLVHSLDYLDVGSYGLQIYVSDIYGNEVMVSIIIEVVDTTPPEWLTSVYDQYLDYGEILEYQLNAYDLSGIESWSLNDTQNFQIDSLGLITSGDYLDVGRYGISVSVIDSFGNELTSAFTVFVITETTTTTTSTTTTTATTTTSTTSTGPTSTTPTTPQEPDPILTLIVGLGLGVAVAVILVIIILRRRARGA